MFSVQPVHSGELKHYLASIRIDRELSVGSDFGIIGTGHELADDTTVSGGDASGMTEEL